MVFAGTAHVYGHVTGGGGVVKRACAGAMALAREMLAVASIIYQPQMQHDEEEQNHAQ